MKVQYDSPLRYPGGKGKVADFFKQVFKQNSLCDGIYVEPYAGGSSVALSLLTSELASKVIINDIDKSIYAFWHSALNDTDRLCRLIHDTKITVESWDKQRQIQKNKAKHGLLKVGFSTFFLNRTNRSGILNAGIIGGREQKGDWKIDARFNKKDLIQRIERVALHSSRIALYNLDAVKLIQSIKKTLPPSTLFYFDPPYYVKGKELYYNFYKHEDHASIATEIEKLGEFKWIVTYDNVKEIRSLYKNWRKKTFSLNYSASGYSKGEEVMIFSDNLNIKNIKITN